MSNPTIEPVQMYQITVTKGMAECICALIGETAVAERMEKYDISEEDSRKMSVLYRRLLGEFSE